MFTRRRFHRPPTLAAVTAAVVLLGGVAAGCGSSSPKANSTASKPTAAPTAIVVQAGINDPSNRAVAVLQFMPAQVSVAVGETVTWSWAGAVEPHSVTFLNPGRTLPPPGDPSVFAPTPPTGAYDGTTFVNSGLQPQGPAPAKDFSMTFAKPGTYTYHCVIHPNMTGTINVVAAGAAVDQAPDVAARKQSEQAQWVAEGEAAAQRLAATAPAGTTNPDGTTTWSVQMGTSTAHTDVLAFAPSPAKVKPGDKVTFVNNSAAPHTASFFNDTPPIVNPSDPATARPAPGPSPQALSATGLYNTGLLPPNAPPGAAPPEAARSYTFTIPKTGTYTYVCILHAPSGMGGTITAG